MSPKVVAIQNPLPHFYKDEGGKQNTLVFRIQLEGELDLRYGGTKGEVPISVVAVFEDDGSPVPSQRDILDVIGCTEKPNSAPALYLTSKLGGVTYRLKQVSKKLDDRKVCVRLEFGNGAPLQPITSEGTMVFSKRKNKDHRVQQQQQERLAMEQKEAEAVRHILSSSKRVKRGGNEEGDEEEEGSETTTEDTTRAALRQQVAELKQHVAMLERQVHEQQLMLQMFGVAPPQLLPPQHHHRQLSFGAWQMPPELRRDASGLSSSFLGGGGGSFGMVQLTREPSLGEYQLPKLVRETSLEFMPRQQSLGGGDLAGALLMQLKREVPMGNNGSTEELSAQ